MYILGLSGYAHESSCCLIKDGKILSLIEEERLNREKHTWKFPQLAIRECLRLAGIGIDDIDAVTFFWSPVKEFSGNLTHFLKFFPESLNLIKASSGGELSFLNRICQMQNVGLEIKRTFRPTKHVEVSFVEHHLAHAAGAFFVSPFDEAAILIMDGRGESTSSTLAQGLKNKVKKIAEIKVPHSIGHLYASITDHLGFRPFFDEWKVMGMSACGKETFVKDFEDVVSIGSDGRYELNLKYFLFHTHGQPHWVSPEFVKRFGPRRDNNAAYEQRHFDIALALQRTVEKAGVALASHLYRVTQSPNLCLTGGVVLNCLMNKEIVEQTPFQNFFILPMANDAGTSLGSALFHYHQVLDRPRQTVFDTAYLGPEFTNEEIETALKDKKTNYKKSADICRETAAFIAQGKIVGWFQGRMEAGPRALGNRSIVINPCDPMMKDRLNARVKKREYFRPFAPSVLEEKVDVYFLMPKKQLSPYMILAGHVRPEKKSIIPAVSHADGTARVHTVNRQVNPKYWQLINEFERISGVPVLLNTSFNENEPIVCTPAQAIDCFLRTEFDILSIGDFIVTK